MLLVHAYHYYCSIYSKSDSEYHHITRTSYIKYKQLFGSVGNDKRTSGSAEKLWITRLVPSLNKLILKQRELGSGSSFGDAKVLAAL